MELNDLAAEAIIEILLKTIVGQKEAIVGQKETIRRLQMQLELKEMEVVEDDKLDFQWKSKHFR